MPFNTITRSSTAKTVFVVKAEQQFLTKTTNSVKLKFKHGFINEIIYRISSFADSFFNPL